MAKDDKAQVPQAQQGPKAPKNSQGGGKQESASPSHCKFVECKKSIEKFGFCMEHYELYMEGVIRGDGKKPSDFEEKLSLFKWKRLKQAA